MIRRRRGWCYYRTASLALADDVKIGFLVLHYSSFQQHACKDARFNAPSNEERIPESSKMLMEHTENYQIDPRWR
jgi:hypothetical protein